MNKYDTDDIIFALATPWGKGAIAVIRISGNGCIEKFSAFFTGKLNCKSNTAVYGTIMDSGEIIDNAVVTVYRDGHGYTGQDALEISCHGGLSTVRRILALLEKNGFRQALGGEFTLRAFVAGKMDLTQSEAVNELINAKGNTARSMALARLGGNLRKRIKAMRDNLVELMSTIEVQLDYAEDEVDENLEIPVEEIASYISEIDSIVSTYRTGKLYSEGAKIVLCGPVNAGKSSLFNLMLKEDRAIVSSIEGTTRDFIEAQCTIEGIPVRLYDTAGLRISDDTIEAEGMKRTKTLLEGADILLYMSDASSDFEPDSVIVNDRRCIRVLNKSDLSSKRENGAVNLSVKTGKGFDELCKAISDKLKSGMEIAGDEAVVIESERQKNLLESASENLKTLLTDVIESVPLDICSADLQNALDSLGEITGEVTSDEVLDRIFSRFCVGK